MEIKSPQSEKEFQEYYNLRFRILREPWDQARGSEKDDLEDESIHVMVKESGEVLGVGRAHFNSPQEAQIRFMAVDEKFRGNGIGSMVLKELEKKSKERGATYMVANARKQATEFYQNHGYQIEGDSHTLFGSVPHFKIKKELIP